jgi:septal ring factor EnvC (AmiA/AmiB activator)
MSTSKRKEALAAGAAFLKVLNEIDEADAKTDAVKRVLEATQAELAETQARLETSKAELAKADAEHARWLAATAKERTKGNARIDELQRQLRVLEEQVAARRQESDSILAGMQALGQRLRFTQTANKE